ncbi:aminotransferase class I/II-fold pyridoxal phosphate-dependent enzyme [Synechococcus sp. RSCCF101]|uniref:aminotransferase class I/II-fold pyridoxal phosphate-dependent enzyme n=1 Tax=Synechococcus sp. RSCCF101 TaxID=2511069 RepID=UPI0012443157|nr:aminotransferase class I/II-fold pyridoxal phosphate-dependent enzyme [Synechococcus sp. RSCCF101]QEY30929.1 aminotransferase class I/II-fold pyridoxal phosphate-dependent enzyme [Synechococcus sp. RSCCF101]
MSDRGGPTPQLSRRLALLGSGVFARNDVRKAAYLRERASRGLPPLIDCSLGSTDLAPPPAALEAMAARLGQPASSSYCLHDATAPLRRAVARWAERRLGVEADPDREILFLVGSQEGTAHLPLALLDPGDRALVLDPCYPSHLGGVLLAGGEPIRLPLRAAEGWRPDFGRLPAAAWDGLRLMVLGYPHNPTAVVGRQEWIEEAAARAARHGAVIAHDNPYLDLVLEGEAPSLLRTSIWRERGIEFFSLSKSWCLGGFRLAFAIGAEPLITALKQVKGVIDFNQSLALQAGAVAALEEAPHWPARLCDTYRTRRDRMVAALAGQGWPVDPPSMALYLWMPVPPGLDPQDWTSERLAAALLEHTGVALTPGNGFGAAGEGWLRLALVHPEPVLIEAAERIGRWLLDPTPAAL